MRETKYVVDYIVQYTDPIYQVDGAVKTRHFPNEEEARRLIETIFTQRIDIVDVQIIRQTSTIVRESI